MFSIVCDIWYDDMRWCIYNVYIFDSHVQIQLFAHKNAQELCLKQLLETFILVFIYEKNILHVCWIEICFIRDWYVVCTTLFVAYSVIMLHNQVLCHISYPSCIIAPWEKFSS